MLAGTYPLQYSDTSPRQTNIKVFQNVIQILQIVKNIAMNMNDNGQKPVYLLDALGRFSPFHLEFIRSAEVSIDSLYTSLANTIRL
jgi:hypothetical protein